MTDDSQSNNSHKPSANYEVLQEMLVNFAATLHASQNIRSEELHQISEIFEEILSFKDKSDQSRSVPSENKPTIQK